MEEAKYVSDCHGANVYWKEHEYFGKYKKSIWICFRCNKPCKLKEKESDND